MEKTHQQHLKKSKKYTVYDSSKEGSFGLWIIPLVILIFIGLSYIAATLYIRQWQLAKPDINTENKKIINPFDDLDIFSNRTRSGEPLNLNEIEWGRSNPLEPIE